MPRRTVTPGALAVAFTYTPGDHHRYTWNGNGAIAVDLIRTRGPGTIYFEPTGDLIPVPEGTRRTATALAALVDSWRGPRGLLPAVAQP